MRINKNKNIFSGMNIKNKTLLITGGTGSFGKALIKKIINKNIPFLKVIIFSRDEFKQDAIEKDIPRNVRSRFRFFLGDIRDEARLLTAFQDVDIILHAAALKQVPKAEYDPFEFIQTNVLGSQNIISAALKTKVKKVIALSTDKASSPANLYGATKLCADKLFLAANNIKGWKNISFSVLRYGNVFGSRGSILHEILKNKNSIIKMTDGSMSRFHVTLDQAVNLGLWAIKYSIGGEIIVPKLPSYKLIDLINSTSPKAKILKIGIRPGEKIHEEMISVHENQNTLELEDKYIICNELFKDKISKHYKKFYKIKKVSQNFSYSSEKNNFLTKSQLIKMTSEFEENEIL
jgi:FlaA1/EpsC-like NDP-sugar epimerase